jgi:hypothetical protein
MNLLAHPKSLSGLIYEELSLPKLVLKAGRGRCDFFK